MSSNSKATKKVENAAPAPAPAPAADPNAKAASAYEPVCWKEEILLKKANGDCYESDKETRSVPVNYYGHVTEDGVVDKDIPEQTEAESDSDSEDVNTTLTRLREKTVGIIHIEIRPTNTGEYIIVKRRIVEEAWLIDNATYPEKDVAVRKLGIINGGVITQS